MNAYRLALSTLIGYWQAEGDTASTPELLKDAKEHLRWLSESMSLPEAAERVMRLFPSDDKTASETPAE